MPVDSLNKKNSKQTFLGLRILTAFVGIILIATTIFFQNIKNGHENELEKQKRAYISLSTNTMKIESIKHSRMDFFKKRIFLDFPRKYSFASANFIMNICHIINKNIRLTELSLHPQGLNARFFLTCTARDPNIRLARIKFLSFYDRLKQIREIVQISYRKKETKPSDSSGSHFTVRGTIEIE